VDILDIAELFDYCVICGDYNNNDLTSIRRPFDCLSNVLKVNCDVTHQWPLTRWPQSRWLIHSRPQCSGPHTGGPAVVT